MNTQKTYADDSILQFTFREMQRFATNEKFWILLVVVTLILGVSGPFSTLEDLALLPRFAYWGGICVFTFFANLMVVLPIIRLAQRHGVPRWAYTLIAGLAGTIPITGVVWIINVYLARNSDPTLPELIDLWTKTAPIAVAITFSHTFFRNSGDFETQEPTAKKPEATFFMRLPVELGTDIYALQAQDHYVRVTTARGKELILVRLEDAVRELEGVDGMRVHRSWWVAKSAIKRTDKEDGKLSLVLTDDSVVPVSRTYSKTVREAFS